MKSCTAHLSISGRSLIFSGRPEEALPLIQWDIRLSPNTPTHILSWEGQAYLSMGRYDDSIAAFERTRVRNPKSPLPLAFLAMTSADMGRMEEARAMTQKVLEVSPGFAVKGFVNILTFKDRAKSEHVLATLLQIGLPE